MIVLVMFMLFEYRRMLPEEKPFIESLCKEIKNPDIKSFPGYWTRFKNWENNPPFVLLKDNIIVGFTAIIFPKTKLYANHYAFAVKIDMQRQGLGEKLWDITIKESKKANKKFIRTGANSKYLGYTFFKEKLGWQPYFSKDNKFKFEADITSINDYQEFKNNIKKFATKPIKQLSDYT